MDARYTAARATDQSGDRGWSFEPNPRPEPTPWRMWLIAFAVALICLSLIASVH